LPFNCPHSKYPAQTIAAIQNREPTWQATGRAATTQFQSAGIPNREIRMLSGMKNGAR